MTAIVEGSAQLKNFAYGFEVISRKVLDFNISISLAFTSPFIFSTCLRIIVRGCMKSLIYMKSLYISVPCGCVY